MQIVPVKLGRRSYAIHIGARLVAGLGCSYAELGLGSRCAIITDSRVGPLYAKQVVRSLRSVDVDAVTIAIPSGEAAKSLKNVDRCYRQLAAHRLERKSCVVALGGGVVGDLAGFVAATYLRGVPFVQIPTTLLAQVDSSVGGKTGVNLKAGKNLVGAFHQPRLVLCDLATLRTLPPREFRSGIAEIIKYGIIYDPDLFAFLEREMPRILRRQEKPLAHIIARSCAIKAEVVSQDETESGLRAILNFGHTIGHAIEAISGYGRYLHGEAISIGQVKAATLSARLAGLPASDVDRIRSLFEASGLPTTIRLNAAQKRRLLAAMRLDKKVSDGEIRFVLARRIGEVVWGQRVVAQHVEAVLASDA
ncbi:MAG: 3-dehydroquinate synthase [Verrucomicrobia bacterium]|nr:3-dehydroquinate synthase [Verrucomicrobiota bacterium]